MSLTATQARILRDMAGGAVLLLEEGWNKEWCWKEPYALVDGRSVNSLERRSLITKTCIHRMDHADYYTYTLTPAGAEAAREAGE